METCEFRSFMQQPFSRVKNLADRRILEDLQQEFFREIQSANNFPELVKEIFHSIYQKWLTDIGNGDLMAHLKLVTDRLIKVPGLAMTTTEVSFLDPFSCRDPRLFHSLCKLAYALCRSASARDSSAFAIKLLSTPLISKQIRDPMVASYRLILAGMAGETELEDRLLAEIKISGSQAICLYIDQIHSSDKRLCQKIGAQFDSLMRSDSLHVRVTAFSQVNKFLTSDESLTNALAVATELYSDSDQKSAGAEEVALLKSLESRWSSWERLLAFTTALNSSAAIELKLNMIRKGLLSSIINSEPICQNEMVALGLFLEELRPNSELIADRVAACKCLLDSSFSPHTRKLIQKILAANHKCEKLRFKMSHYTKNEILRAIVAVSQLGHSCYYRAGRFSHYIIFGDVFGRKLWRFIFETKNRSTHKRQGAGHMIGRKLSGDVFIPSAILCEQVATDVPGEPVFDQKTGSWHNHLPLLDHLISTCSPWRRRRGYVIQTATVQTNVMPPSRLKGISIWFWLSINFSKVAGLRNNDPSKYLAMLRQRCAFQFVFKNVSASRSPPIYRAGMQSILPLDVLYIANDYTQLNPFYGACRE